MSLVVFEGVSLSLGGKPIVENLSLRLEAGERIGLVGPNGSGKSTLLRLIAAHQVPDGGTLRRSGGLRIGYLTQDIPTPAEQGVLAFVVSSVPGRAALEAELETMEVELAEASDETALRLAPDRAEAEEQITSLGHAVAELYERLGHFEQTYSEHEAKRILVGLGFAATDFERPLRELSGGWRMRAVLASLLFQRPDLLLLDEPTNHLDMPSVAWLSAFLQRYELAFILVSHDREFLNEQIRRVVSFEPEGLRSYRGNYDSYLVQREEERVLLENRARNLQKEREHIEQFVDRFRSKASKASQVQSRIRQLERMENVSLQGTRRQIRFRFPPCERTGKTVIETEGLGRSFGDRRVLDRIDLRAERGERIALIGVNGAGKTTLLKILARELEADSGVISYGHNVRVGYFAQHHADTLDRSKTVFDAVAERMREGGPLQVRSALGALLFGDGDVDKPIGVLSGGERARVALARLLVDPGNVLLMDEPTNHLDLESSERLAEALESFEGTLLFVSHNRGFIRRLATRIWSVERGRVETYPGTFDEYLSSCGAQGESPAASRGASKAGGLPTAAIDGAGTGHGAPAAPSNRREDSKARKRAEADRRKKLAPLRRKVEELERTIAELEAEHSRCGAELADPTVYADAARREPLLDRVVKLAARLEAATAEWLEAQERLEAASTEEMAS